MNVYIVPIVEVQWGPFAAARVPKYMTPADRFSMLDYGYEPTCLLLTEVVVSGNDVIDLTALDQNVGNTSKMRNDLRAVNLPGTWLDNQTTNRDVARVTAAVSQIMQRLKQYLPTKQGVFKNNTLSTQWGSLTTEQQTIYGDAMVFCGYDISWFTPTTTIEDTLDYVAGIAKTKPIAVGLMTV